MTCRVDGGARLLEEQRRNTSVLATVVKTGLQFRHLRTPPGETPKVISLHTVACLPRHSAYFSSSGSHPRAYL